MSLNYARRVVPMPALPAVCDPRNGDMCFLTTGVDAGLYVASAVNVWSKVGLPMITQAQSSGAVIVASGAGAGAKGLYVQLLAATTFEASMILLTHEPAGAGGNWLVDIATGLAGFEVVQIPNLFVSGVGLAQQMPIIFRFPIGVRITARVSCVAGGPLNDTIGCTIFG